MGVASRETKLSGEDNICIFQAAGDEENPEGGT